MNIFVVKALAGCGKTSQLYKDVKEATNPDKGRVKILLLSFNRSLKEKAEAQLGDVFCGSTNGIGLKSLHDLGTFGIQSMKKVEVRTVHGLAYWLLDEPGRLPKGFKNLDEDKLKTFDPNGTASEYFDKLILMALELSIKEPAIIRGTLGQIDEVCIDEYQDLRRDHIELIRSVVSACGVKAIRIYGDPNQKLYEYTNNFAKIIAITGMDGPIRTEIGDNFNNISKDFQVGANDMEERVLTKCFRSAVSVQKAINYFLQTIPGGVGDLFYQQNDGVEESVEKSKVRLFSNCREEENWVRDEIEKLPSGIGVCILGQDWKAIESYRVLEANPVVGRMKVTTVHQMKGLEVDIVFVVGVHAKSVLREKPENTGRSKNERRRLKVCEIYREVDRETKDILYTAFSRAKTQLFISTSHPKSALECFRSCAAVDFEDRQTEKQKGWNRFPRIRQDANLTLNKMTKSIIDSLVLKIPDRVAPFFQYVPKGVVPKKIHFGQGYVAEDGGLRYTIIHYNRRDGNGWYIFEFIDLNPLKRSGYDDVQILKKCAEIILNFFDHRINWTLIEISRIDLAFYMEYESMADGRAELSTVDQIIRSTKVKRVADHNGENYLAQPGRTFVKWGTGTYYAGFLKEIGKGRYEVTLRIYSTASKNEIDKVKGTLSRKGRGLSRRNVWKFEWQVRGRAVSRRFCLGESSTLGRLYEAVRGDPGFLRGVHRAISEHVGVPCFWM